MSCRLIAPLDRNSKAIFYDNTVESVYALRWYLAVGAGPCVRPAGTSYDFLPFWANSQCLPRADTQVRPYGGQGRCSGITRHVMLSDCPVRRQPNGDTETLVCALPWYLTVGADPCVRPAGTSYGFLPFSANSQCLPQADTRVRPYGGQGRCSGITQHVTLSDCPVKRQTQWRHRNACLRTTLVFDRRGGPMCPPSGNIIRFSPIFGEFVMPTMGGHTGPALVGTGFSQPQSMIHLFPPDKPAP